MALFTINRITTNFVNVHSAIMIYILCPNRSTRGKKPKKEIVELRKMLTTFYEKIYQPLTYGENTLFSTGLSTLYDYETVKVMTCISNHISMHFYEFYNRYINVVMNKSEIEKTMGDMGKGFQNE